MRSSHNFNYLRQRPWSNVFVEILQAEEILDLSPRSCMIFTRTALEKFMKVVYSIDSIYFFSRNKDLFSLINEPDFKNSIKPGLWLKMEELRTLGNSAVHDGEKIYTRETAIGLLKAFYATSLFLFLPTVIWFFVEASSQGLMTGGDLLIGIPLGIALNVVGIIGVIELLKRLDTEAFPERMIEPARRRLLER